MQKDDFETILAIVSLFSNANVYGDKDPEDDEYPDRFKVEGENSTTVINIDENNDNDLKFAVVVENIVMSCDEFKICREEDHIKHEDGAMYLAALKEGLQVGLIRVY